MKEKKMKVKVIGRDYKETFKDILEEYTRVTKEFGGEYEEREIAIDDGYYIFIADSKALVSPIILVSIVIREFNLASLISATPAK